MGDPPNKTLLKTLKSNAAVTMQSTLTVVGNTVLGDATTDTIASQGTLTHTLPDNTPGASLIQEGTGSPTTYLSFDTTDNQEAVKVELTTGSTTTSTGALIVSGGVGIAENLYMGGNLDVAGNTVLGNAASETVTANAAVTRGASNGGDWVFTVRLRGGDALDESALSSIVTTVEGTFRRAALLSPKMANDKSAISPSS